MGSKSKMPQIGEAVFCIIYLIFGYIAGTVMLLHADGNSVALILGILTLVLAGGDSFHLVPRIINAFKGKFEAYEFYAGLGLMVSSITMTVFYILLYYACGLLIALNKPGTTTETFNYMYYVLITFACVRILLCLFPQNNWFHKEGNQKWGIIRNVPFIVVGIVAVYGCFMASLIGMGVAVIISFACYLPVVFLAKKKPMIGMLMIPKTIAYMYIIGVALGIVFTL